MKAFWRDLIVHICEILVMVRLWSYPKFFWISWYVAHDRRDKDIFSVAHFAGKVPYNIESWLDKNKVRRIFIASWLCNDETGYAEYRRGQGHEDERAWGSERVFYGSGWYDRFPKWYVVLKRTELAAKHGGGVKKVVEQASKGIPFVFLFCSHWLMRSRSFERW